MTRTGVALVIILSGLVGLPACGGDGAPPVTIELAQLPVRRVEGHRVAPPPGGTGAVVSDLLQDPRTTVEFHQRLPRDSVLRFDLPDRELPPARISVASDDRAATPEPARDPAGGWSIPLQAFDDEVVSIRLENPGDAPIRWARLRITGTEITREPPLPAPPAARAAPLNFLVYVIDTLRFDRLSVHGYARPTSPHLEAFARESTVFLRAYSPGPRTLPAVGSLFTSLAPSHVQGRLRAAPDAVTHTVAELFRDAGYDTAAFVANLSLQRWLGFSRGFDTYTIVSARQQERLGPGDAPELHARVLDWLESPRDRPFFLYVQSMDVHDPYAPPPPFRGRFGGTAPGAPPELAHVPPEADADLADFLRRLVGTLEPQYYDDAIAYADHELAALLGAVEALGLRDSTVILVTADHGESLGEGGRYYHGLSVHEELVHVPLLVAVPGTPAAGPVEHVVSLMDLAPTLLDLAGIPPPATFRGRSLLRSQPAHEARAAIGERPGTDGFYEWYVRYGDWKLVASRSRAVLHHLPDDPQEVRDRSAERPILTEYLLQILWRHSPAFRDAEHRVLPVDRGLSAGERAEVEEALRALGYIE
jgi:arylsulfatase A-like enzyme